MKKRAYNSKATEELASTPFLLTPEAAKGVAWLQKEIGREPIDIINGLLVHILEVIKCESVDHRNDGWTRPTESVAEAAALRLSKTQDSAPPDRVVTLNLTPGEYGALEFLAEHDGYASIADCLIGGAAGYLSSIHMTQEQFQDWFQVERVKREHGLVDHPKVSEPAAVQSRPTSRLFYAATQRHQ